MGSFFDAYCTCIHVHVNMHTHSMCHTSLETCVLVWKDVLLIATNEAHIHAVEECAE